MNRNLPQPRVIGLDLSLTGTGLAWPGGVLTLDIAKGMTGPARLSIVQRKVRLIATTPQVATLAVIEAYSFNSQYGGERLGELGGVVRLALHEEAVPFVEVAPLTLKKFATGSGATRGPKRVTKADVLRAARQHLDYPGWSEDEADALWLYTFGMAAHGLFDVGNLASPAAAEQALNSVEWPRNVREYRRQLSGPTTAKG
jgi:Holliday junction resolvasome RuvABC endonuclease subunit